VLLGGALLAAGCGSGGEGTIASTSGASSSGEGGAGGESSSAQSTGGAGQGGGGQGGAGQGGAAVGVGGAGGSGGSMKPPDGPPCEVDGIPGVCVDISDCTGEYAPTPGFCPGPANIQCCTKMPVAGSCDPSAMPTPNDGLVEEPGIGGCPSGMILITDYCIDRFEASLVHVDGGASFSPYFNPGVADLRAVSIEGAVPQGYIDQVQAASACLASGKRLCTDTEWLRACQGPDNFTYPYGDMLEPGVCNDHRAVHPAVEYFGTSDQWIYSHLDNPCLDQLPDSLDPAGARPGCFTFEGAFDMMGNLHEWTADPAGTFRGGYYVDTKINGPGCLYKTTAHNTLHWDYSTGFRCCADLP
jgi:hypothetical protein